MPGSLRQLTNVGTVKVGVVLGKDSPGEGWYNRGVEDIYFFCLRMEARLMACLEQGDVIPTKGMRSDVIPTKGMRSRHMIAVDYGLPSKSMAIK